jgi:hypothetical protein
MYTINEPHKDKGVRGCNLDMLGKGRISIDIIFIHSESRFHSENELKFERVTEYDFWFGVVAVAAVPVVRHLVRQQMAGP